MGMLKIQMWQLLGLEVQEGAYRWGETLVPFLSTVQMSPLPVPLTSGALSPAQPITHPGNSSQNDLVAAGGESLALPSFLAFPHPGDQVSNCVKAPLDEGR